MSLIKWSGGDDDRQALVKRARNLLAENKASVGKREIVQAGLARRAGVPRLSVPAASILNVREPSIIEGPAIIELPRYCAIYDELWIARYERVGSGHYEFTSSAELPTHQQRRYTQDNIVAVPSGFRAAAERCACCQTWTLKGKGSVWCSPGCGARICWGRVTPNMYFRCRDSCGIEGPLVPCETDTMGLRPGGRGGNFGTQF